MADDAPASSGPSVSSCSVGEPRNENTSAAKELIAASRAVFMKLCMQFDGELVYGNDSRLAHSLTPPDKIIGHDLPDKKSDFGKTGRVSVSYIVETDGHVSWAAVLSSSGVPGLDDAAVKWMSGVRYKIPAHLNGTPVRVFSFMNMEFFVN